MGDVAMLQVAAQRIRAAYPNAELLTLTHSAERLERYVGGTALEPRRRQLWLESRALPIPIRKSWLPKTLGERMTVAEQCFQVGYPRMAQHRFACWVAEIQNPTTKPANSSTMSILAIWLLLLAAGF